MTSWQAGLARALDFKSKKNIEALIILGLVMLVLAVFAQVLNFDFVNYDDNVYVYANPFVTQGLTWKGISWAFRADLVFNSTNTDYWQPLTMLSRMLDVELYGLNAGGHHFTNLLFHTANVILLFLAFTRMGAALWPSAMIAALFAVHPMQVDPVAWVTARKDVLSTFFAFWMLWTYAGYAQRPTRAQYYAIAGLYACSLMSKPMLLGMPLILLLLDYWPLGRISVSPFRWQPLARCVLEKWPIALLSAGVFCVVLRSPSETISYAMAAMTYFEGCVSWLWYLGQFLYPVNLVIRYPEFPLMPLWHMVGAMVIILGASYLAARNLKRWPHVFVGWFWFLAGMAPTVGLNHENRFFYVPMIGAAILTVHGVSKAFRQNPRRHRVLAVLAALVISACVFMSHTLAGYWRDSMTLFEYVLRVTKDNPMAENNYADALYKRGDQRGAIDHFTKAIWMQHNFVQGHNNLGVVLSQMGALDMAITHYKIARDESANYVQVYNNLGAAYSAKGDLDQAIWYYREALKMAPEYLDAHANLGNALVKQGNLEEAIQHYQFVVGVDPNDSDAHNNLGFAYAQAGNQEAAVQEYWNALRVKPVYPEAHNNMGNALLKLGRVTQALYHYREALKYRPDYPEAHNNLGVLLANHGNPKEAEAHFRAALQANPHYASAQKNLGLLLAGDVRSSAVTSK